MECKNCGIPLEGNYCSDCGQKVITERITIRYLFTELFNIITNVDRGFLYTIKMLLVAPGEMIRNYLNGQTLRYYHPLRYLIFTIAISVALMLSLGVFDRQQSDIQSMMGTQQSEEVAATQQKMNEEVKKYLNFLPLIMIPFLALFSYLFFRKQPWNYAENLVLHAYTQGQMAIIGTPVIVLSALFPAYSSTLILFPMMGIGILYGTYVFRQFFQVPVFQALVKYFFTYFISYFLLIFVFAIFMVIYLIVSGKIS